MQKYKYFSALATPALNYFTVSKLKSNFKSRAALGARHSAASTGVKTKNPLCRAAEGGNGKGGDVNYSQNRIYEMSVYSALNRMLKNVSAMSIFSSSRNFFKSCLTATLKSKKYPFLQTK